MQSSIYNLSYALKDRFNNDYIKDYIGDFLKNGISLFCHEKAIDVLICVFENSARGNKINKSDVSHKTNTTLAHVSRIITRMQEAGIIFVSADGRSQYVTLTPKGARLAENIQNMIYILSAEE